MKLSRQRLKLRVDLRGTVGQTVVCLTGPLKEEMGMVYKTNKRLWGKIHLVIVFIIPYPGHVYRRFGCSIDLGLREKHNWRFSSSIIALNDHTSG